MKFKGDIIITDPCYIIKDKKGRPSMSNYPALSAKGMGSKKFTDFTTEETAAYKQYEKDQAKWEKEHPDHWSLCEYGDNMEKLGIKHYLTSDTEYGDWSCTTIRDVPEATDLIAELNHNYAKLWNNHNSGNRDEALEAKLSKEREELIKKYDLILGSFCADAGLVSVFLLDEVLAYNPDFDYHLNRKWTTTLIKDFDGDIEITHRDTGDGEEEVSVVGKGNINFYTTQTGL
jgi:hypothetical protein